jgi:hypothetical protein
MLRYEQNHLDTHRSGGLTTEDYIRDAQFQPTTLSIAENNGAPQSAAGPDAIAEMLASRDWSRETVAMHNAQFDAAVLSFLYGIGLHYRYAGRCARNVWLDREH